MTLKNASRILANPALHALLLVALILGLLAIQQAAAQAAPRQAAGIPPESGPFAVYLPVISAGAQTQTHFSPDGMLILSDHAAAASEVSSLKAQTVRSGWAHTCILMPDGRLACWGNNASGQAIAPGGTYTQLSAGAYFNCALKPDRTLTCWGDNQYGQSASPNGAFTQVSAGWYHACAIRTDGTLACWGWNAFNQLDNIPSGVFTQVSAGGLHTCALRGDGTLACWGWNVDNQATPPGGTFTQVSAGGYHTCALNPAGSLACWGFNSGGQATPPVGTFKEVSAGGYHTCALNTAGTVNCWGENGYSQLDNIPPGPYKQVSAGGRHTCGVLLDGSLACWGWNRFGQSVPPSGVQVAAGGQHTCAINRDGKLTCWGENSAGQAAPPAGAFALVSAGYQHNCAVSQAGALSCWGANDVGQSTPPGGMFTQVSAGRELSCAVEEAGALSCWGANDAGQSTPPAGVFAQVSAGNGFACALNQLGALVCWGANDAGQTAPPSAPGLTFVQIAAGGSHACAIQADATLTCWGANDAGQSTPPSGYFTGISAGEKFTCGVRPDNSLVCWGNNAAGQSTPPAGSYTQVSAGLDHACAVSLAGSIACWGSNAGAETPHILLSPETLPDATVESAYNQSLSASGGQAPYTFEVVSGALPAGLALSAEGGLSGTPTTPGRFTFTIEARDSSTPQFSGAQAYTLKVGIQGTDQTPPVITPQIAGVLGHHDWYVGPVKVSWLISDPESDVTAQSGCDPTTLTEDTTGVTLTCTATSTGGTSSQSVTIKIDRTPPVDVKAVPEREPDQSGWYNHPLEIHFTGTDATSGIDSCTGSLTYSGPDSAAVQVSGTCTDLAGNTSAPVVFSFQYDATPPEVTLKVVPPVVYLHGEARVDVDAQDAGSGVADTRCDKVDTSTVGKHSVTCTVTDQAGNQTTASAHYLVIYKFDGFYPPVDNFPEVNKVQAGQTIPIKFRLLDANGHAVDGVETIHIQVVDFNCKEHCAPEMSDLTPDLQLAGLKERDGLYHYNWHTSKEDKGKCLLLIVELGDGGPAHKAIFNFAD